MTTRTLLLAALLATVGASARAEVQAPKAVARQVADMVKAGALGPRDLKEGRIVGAVPRHLKRGGLLGWWRRPSVYVIEGAPTKEKLQLPELELEVEKRAVFLASSEPRLLGGRSWVPIDELPRPQDRHEILFDLDDGRVLNAYEFWTPITPASPEHYFADGKLFGPAAVKALTRHPDPLKARVFRRFAEDVQVLMNHTLFPYPREVFEKGALHRLKSRRSGDEIFLLELDTRFFGRHQLFFGDWRRVARNPVLRQHQVSREYHLDDLATERLGHDFGVVESSDPAAVGRTMTISGGKKPEATLR